MFGLNINGDKETADLLGELLSATLLSVEQRVMTIIKVLPEEE
jgi:hypothetical protein